MKNIIKCEKRLKNIMITDKKDNPVRIERVLKAELINVVRNYFEVNNDDIELSILINGNGLYDIQVNILSRAIKFVRTF